MTPYAFTGADWMLIGMLWVVAAFLWAILFHYNRKWERRMDALERWAKDARKLIANFKAEKRYGGNPPTGEVH